MADAIDWAAIEEQYPKHEGGTPIADNGKYDVEIDSVACGKTTSGKHYVAFKFKEGDGVRYPDLKRWYMGSNPNFRAIYYCRLFQALGVDESGAKKAVEKAEASGDEAKTMDTYAQLLANAATKFHKPISIEVRDQRDRYGNTVNNPNNGLPYRETEFVDSAIRFGNKKKTEEKTEETSEEITAGDIPF